MIKHTFIKSVLAVAMIAGFAPAEVADFDSIDDGAGFNGAVDDITVSGNFSLTGQGFIQENGAVAFLFQNGGMATTLTGNLEVLDNPGDAPQVITVNSLAMGLNADTTLTGFSSGGVVEWQISGATEAIETFTAPTTGSFTNPITTIVWEQQNYVQGQFPTNLDFVDFDVVSPAPIADVFDFNSIDDEAGFDGSIDDISTSGNYSLTGSGLIQENPTTIFLFESGGMSTQITGTMQILSNPGDVVTNVTIDRIGANFDADTTLTGFSAGGTVQEWQISGATAGVQTFLGATTGSFANPIDTIVWDQPNYVQGVFPTNLDFVNFFVATQSPTLKGDVNLDGSVTFLDINSFIMLLSANEFQAEADCDCNGDLDFLDIQPFIDILSGAQ
jgi:hypothetical protein